MGLPSAPSKPSFCTLCLCVYLVGLLADEKVAVCEDDGKVMGEWDGREEGRASAIQV